MREEIIFTILKELERTWFSFLLLVSLINDCIDEADLSFKFFSQYRRTPNQHD
ncbi:MAG: hypothetical protein WED07_15100 [Candidatus Freyarchaeum deiterrae]